MKMIDHDKNIRKEVNKRGINSLIHFTPTVNLMGITEMGKIMSRKELEETGLDDPNYILDYTQMTDQVRYDDPSYINLSIERPNTNLLKRFRQRTQQLIHINWCIIRLNLDPLFWRSTKFSITNAASRTAQNHGIGGTFEHFKQMFKNNILIENSSSSRKLNRNGLLPKYPTDKQAEVLVKESISLNCINEILFETEQNLHNTRAAIPSLKDFSLSVDYQLFNS